MLRTITQSFLYFATKSVITETSNECFLCGLKVLEYESSRSVGSSDMVGLSVFWKSLMLLFLLKFFFFTTQINLAQLERKEREEEEEKQK